MALGQQIRQVRLDAGLSQRQLCGGLITRNMLSQIENGNARPSMDTLQQLAQRLGKPVSYFLEETPGKLPNQAVLEEARAAAASQRLEILQRYQAPDPLFDPERWLLEALTCLELAGNAIAEQKLTYARTLLEQAKTAGEKTPYYTRETEQRRLLLCFEAGIPATELAPRLASVDTTLLLLASNALENDSPGDAGRFLDAAAQRTPCWHYLRGRVWEALADHKQAANHYLLAQAYDPLLVYGCLERCYLAMGDYKQAYFYACKQR